MLDLSILVERLKEGRLSLKSTTKRKKSPGNVLYNIFKTSKVRQIKLRSVDSNMPYTLILNDSDKNHLTLGLARNDSIPVYTLGFDDNRNFSVLYFIDDFESIYVSSEDTEYEINKIKYKGEKISVNYNKSELNIASKDKSCSYKDNIELDLTFIKGYKLEGTYYETYYEKLEDDTNITINFSYNLEKVAPILTEYTAKSDSTSLHLNNFRIKKANGSEYFGNFFIDPSVNQCIFTSLSQKTRTGTFKEVSSPDVADDIITKYIESYTDDLVSLFVNQDVIEEICDLLANPNNLPFEIV